MSRYFAGWDGGGTKTTIVCITPEGDIILRETAGPLNINGNDTQRARESLSQALACMASLPGGLDACAGLCIATAGVSNAAQRAFIETELGSTLHAPVLITGDHQSALFSAFGTNPGIVLIAGTGSICYGQDAHGNMIRCGGRGHLIDDEGSGYAIGRDTLSAIVRAEDGRAAPTALCKAVFSALQVSSIEELIASLYSNRMDKKDIAALATLCTTAAQQGDAAAAAILSKAANALYTLVITVARQLDLPTVSIALAGGVLTKTNDIRQRLLTQLNQSNINFSICASAVDAAYGAACMVQSQFAKDDDTHG